MKEFKANVNPAKTRIDSKLEVMINAMASNDWICIAIVGIPFLLTLDKKLNILKSSPIT